VYGEENHFRALIRTVGAVDVAVQFFQKAWRRLVPMRQGPAHGLLWQVKLGGAELCDRFFDIHAVNHV